jgi:hypothetical protein
MKDVEIHLSREEMEQARRIGKERYDRRRTKGSSHKWKRGNDHSPDKEAQSIGGEMAVGQALGIDWVDSPTLDYDGDIGYGNQVRHTEYSKGRLLLHPEDKDDHKFYLVTGRLPFFIVRGWILGRDGKRKELWKELSPGRPCFVVEQYMLNAI